MSRFGLGVIGGGKKLPEVLSFVAGAAASPASTPVTVPSLLAGDLIVLCEVAVNPSSSSVPSAAVPPGFTQIGTASQSNSDATGSRRMVMSYKIAAGNEGGTTLAAMDAGAEERTVLVFRAAPGIITSVGVFDVEAVMQDTNPAAQTISASGGTVPLVALAWYSSNMAVSPRTMSPAKDGEQQGRSTSQYIAWKFYDVGETPADISVDMDDEGSRNGLLSCYLQIS